MILDFNSVDLIYGNLESKLYRFDVRHKSVKCLKIRRKIHCIRQCFIEYFLFLLSFSYFFSKEIIISMYGSIFKTENVKFSYSFRINNFLAY